ncbi:MAG: hypothetical protein U0401_31250 [Anaerolineae bacterium]
MMTGLKFQGLHPAVVEGRQAHRQGEYDRAVTGSANFALSLNDRHPGIYYDRALAYVGLNQFEVAWNDSKPP